MKKLLTILLTAMLIMTASAAAVLSFNEAYPANIIYGCVAKSGLWGNPATPEAPPAAPPVSVSVSMWPETNPAAPLTGNMSIIIALAVFVATAFITIRLTRRRNRLI